MGPGRALVWVLASGVMSRGGSGVGPALGAGWVSEMGSEVDWG